MGTKATSSPNDGSGVVVGIIDTGINFCHPEFRDPATGKTRIKFFGFIMDPSMASELVQWGECSSTDPYSCCLELGGAFDQNTQICEFSDTVINQKIGQGDCQYDFDGHGTHVAGTAAGSYWGIARRSDLIIFAPVDTKGKLKGDTAIIKGLLWIKKKARALGRPAVVNMSLGEHYDPHDGTGSLDRAVDDVSGPGFVVVVAQGNEGDKPIHAFTTKTADRVRVLVTGQVLIAGWYKNPSEWRIEVCEPRTDRCVGTSSGSDMRAKEQVGATGCLAQVFASKKVDPLNGDGVFRIELSCSRSTELEIKLTQICGEVARVDMWDTLERGIFLSNTEKDNIYGGYMYTVASPGTAKRAITVGAVNSRPDLILDTSGNTDTFSKLGKIANFSSRGPTRDGRIKPNVVAGGAYVCSANHNCSLGNNGLVCSPQQTQQIIFSCDADNFYVAYHGTSMATPVVTGLVALYLQSFPDATPEDVKRWLTSNAVTDVQELGMSYPNVIYGYGKAVWSDTVGSGGSGEDSTVRVDTGKGVGSCLVSLPPPPPSGGGCTAGPASSAGFLTSLLVLSVLIALRRVLA
ncbi:MAG: S8 family serine peptidase [Aquificota bacterium]|nr:S8 family serine peptidase [Aquificota bacterium]